MKLMNILLIVGIVLIILWVLGFLILPALGWILNVIVAIGIILLIIWLLRRVFKLF